MKVYVVYCIDNFWDGEKQIARIFSTEEKAKRYKEKMEALSPENEGYFFIEECEVE
jgi:hypothetical protein